MTLVNATKTQREEIFKEINETTDQKLEVNKEILKKWMETEPHLPSNYDERILASFIRGCKHDLERVKRKLDCYFTCRGIMKDMFHNRDPSDMELRKVTESFIVVPLPKLTPDGARVTYHKIIAEDPSQIDVVNIIKLQMMIGDVRIIEEGPISGDIYVFDAGVAKPQHIPKIFHPMVKKGIVYSQNAMPQRLKQLHVINCPPFAAAANNFIRMFLKPKLKERFLVHSDTDSVFSYVPKEIFPSDLGGEEKPLQTLKEEWWKKLENYTAYFEKQESVYSDESKRVIKNDSSIKEYDEMYGTTGSFHKLNID